MAYFVQLAKVRHRILVGLQKEGGGDAVLQNGLVDSSSRSCETLGL